MPYCPECNAEYVIEVTECPDCRVKLVDSLPEDEEPIEFNWVPLRSVPGKPYAAMVTEILDKEEIPNFVKSDAVSTVYLTAGTGNAVIYVPEEHLKRAEDILNQILDHI